MSSWFNFLIRTKDGSGSHSNRTNRDNQHRSAANLLFVLFFIICAPYRALLNLWLCGESDDGSRKLVVIILRYRRRYRSSLFPYRILPPWIALRFGSTLCDDLRLRDRSAGRFSPLLQAARWEYSPMLCVFSRMLSLVVLLDDNQSDYSTRRRASIFRVRR